MHAVTQFRRIWWGRQLQPPTYAIATVVFLRLLGVVYLIAFVSLWVQLDGLIGAHGIAPAADYLDAVKQHYASTNPPASPIWNLPTLAWISASDTSLYAMCAAGTVLALALIAGLAPLPVLFGLWVLYLSLFHVGQVFLSFQWDILLLETGLAAVFVAPAVWRSRLRADPPPPRLAMWLVWWILFRLMFESGAVKLSWNNWQTIADGSQISNAWESLTALNYHYWTQPLPVWTSWYAAKLPEWFQKLSTLMVLAIELVLPWFIFGPRVLRYVACAGFVFLMAMIAATGNYNFFNLLTVVLALTLLDDRAWPQFLQRRIPSSEPPRLLTPPPWRSVLLAPFAVLVIVHGIAQVKEAVAPAADARPSLESRIGISQFCLVNGYGLFRQMTETRPEIVIEASADGAEWMPYEFRWKPGRLSRRPGFCEPHQPRLDWQMWFEALRAEQIYDATRRVDLRYMSPWFQAFILRLLHGEPKVLGLVATSPFAAPPKFVRIALYQYQFTDAAEGRETGNWWRRELVWIGPGMSLQ
jgi:hypothetical protein